MLGTIIAAVAAAPDWMSHPTVGLDPSWQAAVHMAAHNGIEFGSGINFNYGPLGFLVVPSLYFNSTGVLAALFGLGTSIAACILVLRSSRRVLGLAAALVCTYLAARSFRYVENAELLPLIALLAFLAVLRSHDRARSWVVPALAGAAGAVLLLAKFNIGVVVVVMAIVTVWAVAGGWRGVGVLMASFTATLLVAWTVLGNSPAHLMSWLFYSKEIASGYSTALGLEANRGADFRLLLPTIAIVALGLWHATVGWTTTRRAAAATAVGLFVFVAFKHGFVRHDEHALEFFGLMPAVFLGLAAPKKIALAGFSALVVLLLIADQYPLGSLLDPRPSVQASGSLMSDVVSPGRRRADMEAGRRAQRDSYGLDPATIAGLRGGTVHVDPFETSTMWAYPELHWRPLPAFQSYGAYTAALDEQDAQVLARSDGPERILREMPGAIDDRNPDFESPAATLAMLCNFRQLSAGERWQVLGRVAPRCGAAMPAGSVRVKPGQRVGVPAAPDGTPSLLFARLRGVDSSWLSAAAAFLYKSPETYMETDDGNRFRLVPETADGPLLMSAPAELGLNPDFGFSRQIHSFVLAQRRTLGLNGLRDVEVEFFRVPLQP